MEEQNRNMEEQDHNMEFKTEPQGYYRPENPPANESAEPPEAFRGFYESGNVEKKQKRRGIGGYIATAVISFVVGALFACLLITPSEPILPSLDEGFSFGAFPFEEQKPEKPAAPTKKPEPTPLPTQRPAPSVDGMAPAIQNGINPIPDIVEQVSPGVIGVNGYMHSEQLGRSVPASFGTGFIFSSEGYVMTCEHIIRSASRITVTMSDGTELDAELMGADKTLDVAVLKIDAENICTLKMGDSDTLRVGDFVIAIGDPTGRQLSGTTTYGIVSAVSRTVNIEGSSNTYIQTDAAVNPGSSGGALLNMKGEVVGLTSAKTVTADYDEYGNAISAEGLGFATPINIALETATELITQGYIRHPGIGISVITMDEESAKDYEVPTGVVVYSVTKDGPGEEAGLQVNDIILSCDGLELADQDDFVAYVKTKHVGDVLQLKVWRYGETLDMSIKLGDLNDLGDEIVNDEYADFEFDKSNE